MVRLRRAEREAPNSRDIVVVRSRLEDELGGSVSRSMAARLLGISHTALNRWVKSGDLPVAITARGREEVPVSALVDVYEAISKERETGRRHRHMVEPLMSRQRRRAAQIDPRELISDVGEQEADTGHRRPELRSLAYHRAVARRLRRDTVQQAHHLLWQWRAAGKIDPRYAEEWEQVLSKPLVEIRKLISADNQYARDLRQNSPFAGALSEPERRRILEEIR